jgi:hypothetical protein
MVNYIAILAAVIASFALGNIWFGPIFGKQWMKLQGLTQAQVNKMMKTAEGKRRMKQSMGGVVLVTILGALVLECVLDAVNATTALGGATWGALLWLGFVATFTFNSVLFENKPFRLWLISNGYNLIALIIMGAILAAW